MGPPINFQICSLSPLPFSSYLHCFMGKSAITILKYIFFLALGVFFVWLSVREIDAAQWEQIKASLQRAKLWLLLPVCVALMLSHFFRAVRWKILMEPLGYNPSTFNTFAAVMIGYLVNSAVPRLGEVVKCTILSRYEKVRADRLIGTIVMERAVDVICLLIIFIAALLFQGHIIGDFVQSLLRQFFFNKSGELSTTKIAIYLGILIFLVVVAYFMLRRFRHSAAVKKVKDIFLGIWHGLQSIRFVKNKGWFIIHTILIWSLYLVSTTIGVYALEETSILGIGGALTELAVGSVGMILTPGGIGAYPLLVAQVVGLYGLDKTTIGNALGWLLWSVQTAIVIIGGVVMLLLLSTYNKNKKPSEPKAGLSDEDIATV